MAIDWRAVRSRDDCDAFVGLLGLGRIRLGLGIVESSGGLAVHLIPPAALPERTSENLAM